jgi:hypothetical protein
MKSLNGKLIFCRLTKLVRKTTKLKSLQPKKAEIHAAIHKKKKKSKETYGG